jgi:hypothetical protein
VAPVVELVGTGRHREARWCSTQTEKWQCLPAQRRTGWRHGWGRRCAVGSDAVAQRPARRTEESGEVAGNRSTRRREGGEHDGEAERKTAARSPREEARATAVWHARTRAVGSGVAAAADTAVRRRVRRGERPTVRRGGRRVGHRHTWSGQRLNGTARTGARARGSHAEMAC